MSRLVTVRRLGATTAAAGEQDDALTRIAKYVPAELLAFFAMWTQGTALLPWPDAKLSVLLAGAVIGFIMTLVYFSRFFPNTPPEARTAHCIISTLAFAIHAYTISAAVLPKEYFIPAIALLATAAITLASAITIPTSAGPQPPKEV